MSPAEAAETYMTYMQPYASRANLGGPAITDAGLTWLTEFYGNCTQCTINFQPVHWYDYAYNTYWFQDFLEEAYAVAGTNNRIWITEVGTILCTVFRFVGIFL